LGDWLHFFPEGGRSRTLQLRQPRRGLGKVVFHNPRALIVPLCFYGTQDVLPIGKILPRWGKRVVVTVGEPFRARTCIPLCHEDEDKEKIFQAVSEQLWERVKTLRPQTLARYVGPVKAKALLQAEAPAAAVPTGEEVAAPAGEYSAAQVRRANSAHPTAFAS